ncbi:HAD family hydrolase [Herbidospora galbida]|uniref:HAD family hydrolase n=1 Tax=Herbidospora galbida TaxID=2575442 RepID=A0A4U3MA27_9ACTN|nr:HAD hydrolase-like protein [Herbidospora galbida]TKK85149.1 HAD family hydrolase [Herbidospora galbida]
MGINVGFDLDLTLADTRAAIAAVYEAMLPSLQTPIDVAVAVSRIGWPLEDELAQWLPADEIPAAVALYRSLYPGIALPATVAMPGAHEALAAVRRAGGRIIVVTGKNPRDARRTVDALGLDVDEIAGSVFGADKGAAIAAFGAAVYVGDHVADVEAARAGGAISVAVATGGCTPAQLAERGADVVVADLTEFVSWYTTGTSIPA